MTEHMRFGLIIDSRDQISLGERRWEYTIHLCLPHSLHHRAPLFRNRSLFRNKHSTERSSDGNLHIQLIGDEYALYGFTMHNTGLAVDARPVLDVCKLYATCQGTIIWRN